MTIDADLPPTQVLVFASQKGGSGKTTLSGHIAVEADKCGAGPVALVDADPQGSLAKWWNARSKETPLFAATSVPNLERDLTILRKSGVRLIIIDTPPSVTAQITEVISYADLVVVPTRPSPHDLRAVGLTVDIVQHQRKQMVFVVNSATARARITSDTAVALSQHGTVAPVTLHHRVDFAASMIDGRTVGEINPNSRSAKEVATLWSYLDDRLRRLRRVETPAEDGARPHFEVELLTPMRAAPPAAADAPAPAVPAATAPGGVAVKEPQTDDDARPWHGVDRRSVDIGPPTGVQDRRRSAVFGRRNAS